MVYTLWICNDCGYKVLTDTFKIRHKAETNHSGYTDVKVYTGASRVWSWKRRREDRDRAIAEGTGLRCGDSRF